MNSNEMDYAYLQTMGLAFLPIVLVGILSGVLLLGKSKNANMQRNTGKGPNGRPDKNGPPKFPPRYSRSNFKRDPPLRCEHTENLANVHQHPHQYHQNTKQRNPRGKPQHYHNSGQTSGLFKNNWFPSNAVFNSNFRFMSGYTGDKSAPVNHNSAHCNNSMMLAANGDDVNSSSSNEDANGAGNNTKKHSRSRQRRHHKRLQQQQLQQGHANRNNNENYMDSNEDSKENDDSNEFLDAIEQSSRRDHNNLRKQCTKAAAFKAINKTMDMSNNFGSTVLTPSNLNASFSSTLSTALATMAIPSTVSYATVIQTANSLQCSSSGLLMNPRIRSNVREYLPTLDSTMRQFIKLRLTEEDLVQRMRRYLVDPNLLRIYGYPVESCIHEGCIEIYRCVPKPFRKPSSSTKSNVINANDGLGNILPSSVMNGQWDSERTPGDSGQGSGNSSPPSIDSDSSEVGEDESNGTTVFITPDGYQIFSQYDQALEKQCIRCTRAFHVTPWGEYLSHEECVFHWGKLYTDLKSLRIQYTCCQGNDEAQGCTRNELHVWTGSVVGLNGPYRDFIHTIYRPHLPPNIYALDCEMSFTGRGLELTKVAVVGCDGRLIYDHFVRPQAEIVDYNTRFSGVTEKDLCVYSNKLVKTLQEVQYDLLQLFHSDTILVGHGLDNDLRALRIVHKNIVDTSITFPHANGFPFRRSLKHLTKMCLNRDIQMGYNGHSNVEDAKASLEVMLWKVGDDMMNGVHQ